MHHFKTNLLIFCSIFHLSTFERFILITFFAIYGLLKKKKTDLFFVSSVMTLKCFGITSLIKQNKIIEQNHYTKKQFINYFCFFQWVYMCNFKMCFRNVRKTQLWSTLRNKSNLLMKFDHFEIMFNQIFSALSAVTSVMEGRMYREVHLQKFKH